MWSAATARSSSGAAAWPGRSWTTATTSLPHRVLGRPATTQSYTAGWCLIDRQWAVFDATQQLFAANGVLPDATATLADAERGRLDEALDDAAQGARSRPFLDMHDAHAWALHLAGRDEEALQAIDLALQLGTRNARFHFHAGMIAVALGDTARADRELSTALSINPHFDPLSVPVARAALAELRTGR